MTIEPMNCYDAVKASDIMISCTPSVTNKGQPTPLWILDHRKATLTPTVDHLQLTKAGSQPRLETLVKTFVLGLLLVYSGLKLEPRTVRLRR